MSLGGLFVVEVLSWVFRVSIRWRVPERGSLGCDQVWFDEVALAMAIATSTANTTSCR